MNKTELVDAIARDSGLSRADSARAIDSLINTVQKTLKKGDDVAITGFGEFSVAKRGARTGRNPATGATLKIKASKAPKFTADAVTRAIVNRLLHDPTLHMKDMRDDRVHARMALVRDLFGLSVGEEALGGNTAQPAAELQPAPANVRALPSRAAGQSRT